MSNQNDAVTGWHAVLVEIVNGLGARVSALENQRDQLVAEYECRIRELERNVDELNTRLYSQGEA